MPLISLIVILSAPLLLNAQTINSKSCNASDVQAAFNAVTGSTTLVTIPAGTCTWTTAVTLNVPSGSTSLSVLGAGNLSTTGGGDQTVIVDGYASSNSLLVVNSNSNTASNFRLAGITLQGGSGQTKYGGILSVNGSSHNFRIDHIHFNTSSYSPANNSAGARLNGCIYGVADHNVVDANSGGVNNGIQEEQGTCNGDSAGFGHGAWSDSTNLGSANSFYLENNVFNNGAANDCLRGGRFVFRFNTFNTTSPAPTVQTHATGSMPDAGRGCRSWEIYKNTANAQPGNYMNTMFFADSGTGVVWGNTVPSSTAGGGTGYKSLISGHVDRADNSDHTATAVPNGWGYCGTSFTGSGTNWDQNGVTSTGYACVDQLGRGKGDLLSGNFPSVQNTATGCGYNSACAWPRQALEPIYEWGNAYSPVPNNPSNVWNQSNGQVTKNADYYLGTADSGSQIAFTGTSGVGSGTLASRPSTCTTGVAYWATDQGNWNHSGSGGQGVLFKCASTNSWTQYYTPYTYPHPLASGTTPQQPAPPAGLTSSPK
jgi:hypothetical protein